MHKPAQLEIFWSHKVLLQLDRTHRIAVRLGVIAGDFAQKLLR